MDTILLGAVALGLLWSVTTLGVYLTFRVLDVADMTVEGSIVLGASVAATLITMGVSPILATLAAMGAGMLAGLVTAFFHTVMKIPPLLAGILSMIGLYSINIRVMLGTSNISLLRMPTLFSSLVDRGMGKNTATILVGVGIAALLIGIIYWFLHTEIGSALRATGNNPQMAQAQGIDTNRMKVLGYMISNGLVGLSGGLIAQYLGFSDVQMGTGSIVIGLASLFISEVLFRRQGGMLRTLISLVLGSITYRVIIALVFEAGMPATDLKLFTALTVAVALYLPYIRGTVKKRPKLVKLKKEVKNSASVR